MNGMMLSVKVNGRACGGTLKIQEEAKKKKKSQGAGGRTSQMTGTDVPE